MKLKMFLRGVGAGILLCAVVIFAAYKTSGNSMSDKEIMDKAIELGMVVTEEDNLSKVLDKDTTEDSSTETNTTESSTTEASNKKTKVTFEITRGMTSTAVAQILQEQGVIEDYRDFDSYLDSNGYSYRISIGTFEVTVGDSYEVIAKTICP